MLKEFKEFAMRGNVVDMAVGIIIGGAFGTIVKSMVSDVLMPPIGLLLGNVNFSNMFLTLKGGDVAGPYATPEAAAEAGAVTVNYGVFIDNIISFDRRVRRLPPHPVHQQSEEEGRGSATATGQEGLRVLLHIRADQGDALPPLHVRVEGRVGLTHVGPGRRRSLRPNRVS